MGRRCASSRESIPVKGAAPSTVELRLHAARTGGVRRHACITWRMRCAPRGSSRAPRPISPACEWIRRAAGTSSATRAPTAASRARTWCGRTGTGTSAGRPSAIAPIRPNWSGLVAGARRWTLRVERLSADQGEAACAQSREGFHRDGEQRSIPAGLPAHDALASSGPTRTAGRESPKCSARAESRVSPT